MKIIIDADACPRIVLQTCLELGKKFSVPVWTVANFNHDIISENHIRVGNTSQETDIKIMNLVKPADIVITQDIGLAAMVIGRRALALGLSGKEYQPEMISFMLEERELKAKYRRSGGRAKGPSKRTDLDDQHFSEKLESILENSFPVRPNSSDS